MRKILTLCLVLFVVTFVHSAQKGSRTSYLKAIDSLKDLNTQLAYKRLETIIRDFPGSEEARKAVLLKTVISATEFSSFDMLADKYSEALKKAGSNNIKQEIIKLYNKTSENKISSGKNLTSDAQVLLKDTNKSIFLEIKKGYDSLILVNKAFLPMKDLENGNLPDNEGIKSIEDFYKDGAFRHILGKVLAEDNLTAKKTINKEVDWASTMLLMGSWLVHAGAANKSGWLDPATNKMTKSLWQAEKSFTLAKQCFEKAKKLSRDRQVKAQADERIKEIEKILKEFN